MGATAVGVGVGIGVSVGVGVGVAAPPPPADAGRLSIGRQMPWLGLETGVIPSSQSLMHARLPGSRGSQYVSRPQYSPSRAVDTHRRGPPSSREHTSLRAHVSKLPVTGQTNGGRSPIGRQTPPSSAPTVGTTPAAVRVPARSQKRSCPQTTDA